MNRNNSVLLIGGDRRKEILKDELIKNGFTVFEYDGNKEKLKKDYRAVILPVPVTRDGTTVNCGTKTSNYILSEILENIKPGTTILGGATSDKRIYDVCLRNDFAFLNAVPTAEAAIAIAIDAGEKTLFESKILITGFGRVAKILADRLKVFCPRLYVAARKSGDLCHIKTLGLNPLAINELEDNIDSFEIVFNTVPSPIFNQKVLSRAKSESIFIELASRNLGFDMNAVGSNEIRFIPAPSLPSKNAPLSSGKALADTVLNILLGKNV